MKRQLRILENIHEETAPRRRNGDGNDTESGGDSRAENAKRAKEAMEEKLSKIKKLSLYRQMEYNILLHIAELRKSLTELQKLEREHYDANNNDSNDVNSRPNVSGNNKVELYHLETAFMQEKSILRQNCRKHYHAIQTKQRELEPLLQQEIEKLSKEKKSDKRVSQAKGGDGAAQEDIIVLRRNNEELKFHMENAIQWYREYFNITVVSNATSSPAAPSTFRTILPEEGNGEEREGLLVSDRTRSPGNTDRREVQLPSAREDAEFLQFFQSVEQNDMLMDEHLDRIYEGVERLKENATLISGELDTQSVLLTQIDENIERNAITVAHMNKRLKTALKELKAESMCSYICCLILLIVLLCVLLKMIA